MDRYRSADELIEILGDWATAAGPLYRRLVTAVAGAITSGALGAGERLPSERDLARTLVISRATVTAAYDELRARGLVASLRGSGTRVAAGPPGPPPGTDGRVPGGRATSIFQRFVDGPGEVISLAHAIEGPVPDLRQALLDLVRDDLPHLTADAGYHPRGLPALREAIAAHLTGLGLPTAPDQVLVTAGASQAIGLVTRMHLRERSDVVVESPGWPGCFDVFRAAGARLHGVRLDEEGARADEIERAFTGRRPSLLFVMPTYHNPTGVLMSAARRSRIARLAERHGVPVLEDNAYTGLTGEVPPPIAAYGRPGAEILTAGSLAKAVWGGLRIGWIRASAETTERLARHKALADLGSPVLDQALAARFLPRLPELEARRSATARRRLDHLTGLLRERFPTWRWTPPQGGAALWIELPGIDARSFAHVALRHGVEIVPGAAMDPGGHHDDHIRLPFTFPTETLTELVNRLSGAWTELQRSAARPSLIL
ncbi:PLP-dependent aminotransferase family protein [Actinomadura sp. NEAU-AAG7]|uniref:aminotransferase-like domain-containing protein n=1 Tax=Actinomadura sp. NEAU-AAG7 TaxID=2839640 RepID=UPI002032EB38|nr:PLP-dependent aminotransferase family protein [Actinomadura sp. NEAU-AAG7]